MGSSSGDWGEIVDRQEVRLSQESRKAEQAEALRSSSDDESPPNGHRSHLHTPAIEPADELWWVTLLKSHVDKTVSVAACPRQRPVKVLSSCTGTCAEGTVLEATARAWQGGWIKLNPTETDDN